jgi:phenylacetate-CoA ligase
MLRKYYQESNINVLLKMYSVKAADHFSVEQIKNLQTTRFRKLLRHVLQYSIFYQHYYKQHGITLKDIDHISLQNLPTINKQIMMDNYDNFVCDRFLKRKDLDLFLSNSQDPMEKYHNIYTLMHTSGSSGTISLFVYGPNDWAVTKALAMTRVIRPVFHLFRRTKIAFIGASDGHYAGVTFSSDAPRLLARFLPLSINSPRETINQQIDAFHPDVLGGYSSGIHLLAQEQLKGNISIKPERIICSSDPLTSEMRQMITGAFGREPVNFYAASESLAMGAQCGPCEHLHLFSDWHIFEALDGDLRPAAAGIPGNLFLTNLYNYTQPLIRYQMNDEVAINEPPCDCGRPFPSIANLAGRLEEFLWFDTAAGKRDFLHPIVLVEFFVAGLRKFQFIQMQRNALLMKVILDGSEAAVLTAISQRMNEILSGKELDKTVKLNIEVVEDIPNDPKTGKYKLIIPLNQLATSPG